MHGFCSAAEKPIESMAPSRKNGGSSESSGSSSDSEAEGTGNWQHVVLSNIL